MHCRQQSKETVRRDLIAIGFVSPDVTILGCFSAPGASGIVAAGFGVAFEASPIIFHHHGCGDDTCGIQPEMSAVSPLARQEANGRACTKKEAYTCQPREVSWIKFQTHAIYRPVN